MTAAVAAPPVRFQLLGRFEVSVGGRPVPVGGPTAQAVLVALLLRPQGFVEAGQLVTEVWGRPDGVGRDSVYHYLARLRKALAPLGVRIDSRWPGYRLVLPEHAGIDAARFEELVRSAKALRRTDPEQATHRLRAALDLWQEGSALAGLSLPGARRIAERLDELRLAAAEQLAELELARGQPDEVLARLRGFAATRPDSGRLTAAVMRALHATGRAGEALSLARRAEQAARRVARELPEPVRRARREVLGDQPPLAASQPATFPAAAPYQLPADTSHFTGRTVELAQLRALWPDGGTPTAPGRGSEVPGGAAKRPNGGSPDDDRLRSHPTKPGCAPAGR